MANEQNLKPFKKGDKSRLKDQRKGGQKRSLVKKMSRRLNCNKKCPLYPCEFHNLSKEKYKGKCALRQTSDITYDAYKRIMLGGQNELHTEMRRVANKILVHIEKTKDIKDIRLFLQDLGTLDKHIYGLKTKVEGDMNVKQTGVITFDDLKNAYKNVKEDINGTIKKPKPKSSKRNIKKPRGSK